MRLFFNCGLVLLVSLSLLGCTGLPSRFADRGRSESNEREQLLADINTRMSQGDFEGARRLMDRLDPQAQAQAESRQQRSRQQGVEIAAQVEQTSFENGQQNRTLPDRNRTQTAVPPPGPRNEREWVTEQLLALSPPESRDYQRRIFDQQSLPHLQTMLANANRTRATGQQFTTFPEINPRPGTQPPSSGDSTPPPLPTGLESAATGRLDAPEPGAGMSATGIPGVGFPTLSGSTGTGLLPDGTAGPAIQPAAGNNLSGGVIPASGSDTLLGAGNQLPLISSGNPFPAPNQATDSLQPRIDAGEAGLRNPTSIPDAGTPAVIVPRLDDVGGPQPPGPGHSPVNGTGSFTMPLPPHPTVEESPQPGMFSQNLAVIQRAGETIKARVWGQEETQVNTTPLPPVPPIIAAIRSLEDELLETTPEEASADEIDYQQKAVALRALYLAQNEYAKAIEPIQKINAADREFWQQVFWAMSNHFNTDGIDDPNARAAETIEQLRAAISQLQTNADLRLKNVTFCHSIVSFGNYERFSKELFTTGQPVLLYAEVENFNSRKKVNTDSQIVEFHTALSSEIRIFRYGRQDELPVATIPFDVTRDVCRSPRRDYFHSYEFTIPEELEAGHYMLVLSVSDQLGNKHATNRVQFEVD